jgi:hypothetical protein
MYECHIEFIPKGKSPRKTSEMRTISFDISSNNKNDIIDEAYNIADTRYNMDSYALRNHWEIFEIDISYKNPPWEDFEELCGELMSYSETLGWKSKSGLLHIKVSKDKERDVINKIEKYYNELNPRIQDPQIITVDIYPNLTTTRRSSTP